ncbi:hypothetical protein FSP39_017434, partial [Pinctada imbricata]
VFQKRKDGSVNFYRNWADYKYGFGNQLGEYWLGNDALHLLTKDATCTLRVDLETLNGVKGYSKFTNFNISSESGGYRMSYTSYSGTAGDSFLYHKGIKFSTYDKDNDLSSGSCAKSYSGAWWYRSCHRSNLNGLYGGKSGKHMQWKWRNGNVEYMRKTKMMIKC